MIDFETASTYWSSKEANSKRMPTKDLCKEVRAFADAHKVGCLATSLPDGFVRNTPIEYLCAEGAFWMFSEGGMKFRGLAQNPNVCFAVYDQDPSFKALGGMQVMGLACVVEPFNETYERIAKRRGLDVEKLRNMPTTLNLICVRPVRVDFLKSSLADQGYDARQWLAGDELAPFGLL